MEETAPASSAMPQLPEPMSGSGAHIRAQRWLSLLVPVSLSRSINPREQGGQRGCVSCGGPGGRRVLGDFILPPSNAIAGSSQ